MLLDQISKITGLAYRSSTSTSYLLDWKNKTIAEFTISNSNSSTTNVIYSPFGMKTMKAFTMNLQGEIIISDHSIRILSYDGKYLRQTSSINQQRMIARDIHIHERMDV
ncbi:unnamed protein product [Rotaria sordida]|uniref:Uncharacterized protein n=1 Tax=Rotaria sordida TaxID=392033 RepID=A0A815MZF9_9BILA|nr:unnamed protein product [Rotaria sordida]CAF3916488.1 unnamed protein product [Rotaria sordida]